MIFMMFAVAYLLCCLVYLSCHAALRACKWLLTRRSKPAGGGAAHGIVAAAQAITAGVEQDSALHTDPQANDVPGWTALDDRQLYRLLDREEPGPAGSGGADWQV